MGVILDVANRIKEWIPKPHIWIFAEDHAEKLICSICGKQYVSRGKWDPGICRECEKEEAQKNSYLIGGPYDGQKAGDPE